MRRLLSTEYTYTPDSKKLSRRSNPSENENKLLYNIEETQIIFSES